MTATRIPLLCLLLTGCGSKGLPMLGAGSHDADALSMRVVLDEDDGLNEPRDLAFNPESPEQLWVVNRADESMVIAFDPGDDDQDSEKFDTGPVGEHFFAQPAAIAFGDNGLFATIHETDERTQGPTGTPEDFMGPTLWTSDLDTFDAGHGGHMDMLHNSPNGMGIAWEEGNTYWVFDGYNASISRYAFHGDHGPGGADHSDGEMLRYVEGEVERIEDVPSHLWLEGNDLFIADTGNQRIAVLDIDSGDVGGTIGPNYDGIAQQQVEDADIATLIDGDDLGNDVDGRPVPVELQSPSGVAVREDILYVTDNETSTLFAFTTDGTVIDWVELPVADGALMGIEFDDSGNLYLVDAVDNEVLRIDAPAD